MKNSSFGFEKPEDSPGFLLWQTTLSWQRKIKQMLAPFDLTHTDFVILASTLWLTECEEEVNQALVSEITQIDKMTVSKALKKLVADQLILRSESKKDTRAKCLALSSKGKKLISKLVPLVEKIDANFFGKVSSIEQKRLINILSQLSHE